MAKNLYDELQRKIERGEVKKTKLLDLKKDGLLTDSGQWSLGYEEGKASGFEICQDLIANGSAVVLNAFTKKVGENNVKHGFRDEQLKSTDFVALIHSKISEVLEEFRNGHSGNETYYTCKAPVSCPFDHSKKSCCDIDTSCNYAKPEGVPSELADVIIRCLDMADYYGIDIEKAIIEKMNYNKTRPYKHGKEF